MKPKELIDNGKTLYEIRGDIPIFEDTVVSYGLMNDMAHSKYFAKAFESYFFKFVDAFLPKYGDLTSDQYNRLKIIFTAVILTKHSPLEFVDSFILKDFDSPDQYGVLFQNAFIYAIACTYKSLIIRTYMRPKKGTIMTENLTQMQRLEHLTTGKVNGSYLLSNKNFIAHHADSEYVEYMISAHPLLTTFVKSKNRLHYKKILSVLGYLINSDLEKE